MYYNEINTNYSLMKSVIKIQSIFRGYMIRKNNPKRKNVTSKIHTKTLSKYNSTEEKLANENFLQEGPGENDEFIFKNNSRYKGDIKRSMAKR